MTASIRVFDAEREIFHERKELHKIPASSTRAELYGVVMELDYAIQITRLNKHVRTLTLYGDNQISLKVVITPQDDPSSPEQFSKNPDLEREIFWMLNEIPCPTTSYIYKHIKIEVMIVQRFLRM